MSAHLGTILAVDDSLDDLTLLQMAFRQVDNSIPLKMVEGGQEALDYLEGKGKYSDRQTYPLPTLIILDLKMPKVNGFDILSRVSQLELQPTPFVVVMSCSALSQDIEKAKSLGAFAYHTKPPDFTHLCEIASRLSTFFAKDMSRCRPALV